ncbi:MAG: electron transfer flavoprotein-ubiquinone oxidoreductase [Gammaproteobacteria bacterium]|nr:electron transfer flavoprotein-ubiquinone oxidoreductase [Gammaproteobacteria bacterium]
MTEAIERDVMEFDVVIVGAGPAGLACAIRCKQQNPELMVCVLEKGSEVGAQVLSGAVIEPSGLDLLFPDWRDDPPAICVPAVKDEFSLLTAKWKLRLFTPPQMNNHGNYIVSLGGLCAWLASRAEDLGVEIYPGFAAAEVLLDESGERVIGIRTGDMGVDAAGLPKDGYTPGIDIHARVTVLAEGCRGSLSKQLISRFKLDEGCEPQTYGIGIKELWQLPEGRVTPGLIQHSVGWPLDSRTYGGSFLYHLDQDRVAVGFVTGLDYSNPYLEPYEVFQQFKNHPKIKPLFEGGEIISSGARAIVEGGLQSLPKLELPGALLIGDSAGMVNVPKIKGTHMAMHAGIMAADRLATSQESTGWDAAWRSSPWADELKQVRNIRPGFRRGLWLGLVNAGIETITFGRLPWTLGHHADHSSLKLAAESDRPEWPKRDLPPRDRLAGVYFAATEHDENQPVHLQVSDTDICITRCREEYGNPCTRFCPANVYEMVEEQGAHRLQINSGNCVHCKTCDIKDPYQIINWVTPEGGSGPNYQGL